MESLSTGYIALIVLALAWSFVWKGITLWSSARNNQKAWYIVILLINTLGLLEIIYWGFFQKKKG